MSLHVYIKQADELSFEEGDLLYVYDNNQSNFNNRIQARCGNQKGWIPSNYGKIFKYFIYIKILLKSLILVEEQVEEIILPLHEAARRGNISFMRECLEGGVSGTGLDSTGNTPLYWAARSGHLDCVKLLLNLPNPAVNAQVRCI